MNVAEVQTYNGWGNHETWLANLWLTSDESSYRVLDKALAKDTYQDYDKAEWLEMMLRCQLDDEMDVPCLWQDLLQSAFGRIDWQEIIEKNIG